MEILFYILKNKLGTDPNPKPGIKSYTTNFFLVMAGVFTHQRNGCYSDTLKFRLETSYIMIMRKMKCSFCKEHSYIAYV